MQEGKFKAIMARLDDLTPRQRTIAVGRLTQTTALDEVTDTINAHAAAAPSCPHCHSEAIQKWGHSRGIQRFRCKGCRKTFNALTGTPLARLHRRAAWPAYATALRDGLSVRKAAKRCGVHYTTAFRWRHRWLRAPCAQKDTAFTGIVEADETFFLESYKGSRAWARHAQDPSSPPPPARKPRKRGGKAAKRGLSEEQIAVIVVRDRHGATTDTVLSDLSRKSVTAVLKPLLNRDTLLCTDGALFYKAAAKAEGFAHQPLNTKAGTRVKERVFHIQHVNAYHERMKGWMRRFRGVATKHLPNYLGWRRMVDRGGDDLSALRVLSMALA
jgi:transposase-like protein